jgi:hypothetical protein
VSTSRGLQALVNARGLAAWCGTDRLSAVAPLAQRAADRPLTRAAAPYALFVAGREVPASLLPSLDPRLVEVAGDQVRAKVAVLPLGESLIVCDRLDAPPSSDLVCWPDDSSYHLARCLPPDLGASTETRGPSSGSGGWLDVACGSAFAPLWRRRPATCADLNPRAVAYARLGAELSGVALDVVESDLFDAVPDRTWDVVSCNAPIPGGNGPLWRATTEAFFTRLFAGVRARLVVIHGAEAALAALADLPGSRRVVAYTPEPGFAVAWWEPAGASSYVVTRTTLTSDHPHVTYADRM